MWNPKANKEGFAPSAVEVLRIIDETLDAYFQLPIPMHPALLPDLMSGLDRCLQYYAIKAKSGCGKVLQCSIYPCVLIFGFLIAVSLNVICRITEHLHTNYASINQMYNRIKVSRCMEKERKVTKSTEKEFSGCNNKWG